MKTVEEIRQFLETIKIQLRQKLQEHGSVLRGQPVLTYGNIFFFAEVSLVNDLIKKLSHNISTLDEPFDKQQIEAVLAQSLRELLSTLLGTVSYPLYDQDPLLYNFLVQWRQFMGELPPGALKPAAQLVCYQASAPQQFMRFNVIEELSAQKRHEWVLEPVFEAAQLVNYESGQLARLISAEGLVFDPKTLFEDLEFQSGDSPSVTRHNQGLLSLVRKKQALLKEKYPTLYSVISSRLVDYRSLMLRLEGAMSFEGLLSHFQLALQSGGKHVTSRVDETTSVTYHAVSFYVSALESMNAAQRERFLQLSDVSLKKRVADIESMLNKETCVEIISTHIKCILDNPNNQGSLSERIGMSSLQAAKDYDTETISLIQALKDVRHERFDLPPMQPKLLHDLLSRFRKVRQSMFGIALIAQFLRLLPSQDVLHCFLTDILKDETLLRNLIDHLYHPPRAMSTSEMIRVFITALFIHAQEDQLLRLVALLPRLAPTLLAFSAQDIILVFQKMGLERFRLIFNGALAYFVQINAWTFDEFSLLAKHLPTDLIDAFKQKVLENPSISRHLQQSLVQVKKRGGDRYVMRLERFVSYIKFFGFNCPEIKVLFFQLFPKDTNELWLFFNLYLSNLSTEEACALFVFVIRVYFSKTENQSQLMVLHFLEAPECQAMWASCAKQLNFYLRAKTQEDKNHVLTTWANTDFSQASELRSFAHLLGLINKLLPPKHLKILMQKITYAEVSLALYQQDLGALPFVDSYWMDESKLTFFLAYCQSLSKSAAGAFLNKHLVDLLTIFNEQKEFTPFYYLLRILQPCCDSLNSAIAFLPAYEKIIEKFVHFLSDRNQVLQLGFYGSGHFDEHIKQLIDLVPAKNHALLFTAFMQQRIVFMGDAVSVDLFSASTNHILSFYAALGREARALFRQTYSLPLLMAFMAMQDKPSLEAWLYMKKYKDVLVDFSALFAGYPMERIPVEHQFVFEYLRNPFSLEGRLSVQEFGWDGLPLACLFLLLQDERCSSWEFDNILRAFGAQLKASTVTIQQCRHGQLDDLILEMAKTLFLEKSPAKSQVTSVIRSADVFYDVCRFALTRIHDQRKSAEIIDWSQHLMAALSGSRRVEFFSTVLAKIFNHAEETWLVDRSQQERLLAKLLDFFVDQFDPAFVNILCARLAVVCPVIALLLVQRAKSPSHSPAINAALDEICQDLSHRCAQLSVASRLEVLKRVDEVIIFGAPSRYQANDDLGFLIQTDQELTELLSLKPPLELLMILLRLPRLQEASCISAMVTTWIALKRAEERKDRQRFLECIGRDWSRFVIRPFDTGMLDAQILFLAELFFQLGAINKSIKKQLIKTLLQDVITLSTAAAAEVLKKLIQLESSGEGVLQCLGSIALYLRLDAQGNLLHSPAEIHQYFSRCRFEAIADCFSFVGDAGLLTMLMLKVDDALREFLMPIDCIQKILAPQQPLDSTAKLNRWFAGMKAHESICYDWGFVYQFLRSHELGFKAALRSKALMDHEDAVYLDWRVMRQFEASWVQEAMGRDNFEWWQSTVPASFSQELQAWRASLTQVTGVKRGLGLFQENLARKRLKSGEEASSSVKKAS
jgi:hypothetical protein